MNDSIHEQNTTQEQGHEHTHGHEPSHTHEHDHSYTHDHGHSHPHPHVADAASGATSKEELLALLSYMGSHNKHHSAELADLAGQVSGEAAAALQSAIQSYAEGNAQLEKALQLMNMETHSASDIAQ